MNADTIPHLLTAANLAHFAGDASLSPGYGTGLDERCVEWPWALANLPSEARAILDAGSTFNHPLLALHPVLTGKRLHILTANPEDVCLWQHGVSYVYADLRRTPLRDEEYGAILCVSVLEHVGMDNRRYGGAHEHDLGAHLAVLPELRRMLRPGGTLVLTVPFGQAMDLGWQQQFDLRMLGCAVAAFRPSVQRWQAYRRYADGWRAVTPDDCADARYEAMGLGAEAVACLTLIR